MCQRDRYLVSSANKGDVVFRHAVGEIIARISSVLPALKEPIKMYLAGGMAVNFYTGYRPTVDVDASFSHRLLLPKEADLVVPFLNGAGQTCSVYFDMNYNASFALMHPDFERDSYKVLGQEFVDSKIELRILSPVDLAVSKLSRFEGNDQEDINELARCGLISANDLEKRAKEAVDFYIGNPAMLLLNLRDALSAVSAIEKSLLKSKSNER